MVKVVVLTIFLTIFIRRYVEKVKFKKMDAAKIMPAVPETFASKEEIHTFSAEEKRIKEFFYYKEELRKYVYAKYPDAESYFFSGNAAYERFPNRMKEADVVIEMHDKTTVKETINWETLFGKFIWEPMKTEKPEKEEKKSSLFSPEDFMKKHLDEFMKLEQDAKNNGLSYFVMGYNLSDEELSALNGHLIRIPGEMTYCIGERVDSGFEILFESAA